MYTACRLDARLQDLPSLDVLWRPLIPYLISVFPVGAARAGSGRCFTSSSPPPARVQKRVRIIWDQHLLNCLVLDEVENVRLRAPSLPLCFAWLPCPHSLLPAAAPQDVMLLVSVNTVANIAEFSALCRSPDKYLALHERRFISAVVNHVCYWLFSSFVGITA